jgi:hypothetical protein
MMSDLRSCANCRAALKVLCFFDRRVVRLFPRPLDLLRVDFLDFELLLRRVEVEVLLFATDLTPRSAIIA